MVGLALRISELQDEHVLSHPALFLGHDRSDTQCVALLGQDGVSAVAGTVGPNLLGLRELGDVLLIVARPCNVLLALLQRSANGVQSVDEISVRTNLVQGILPHAGHDSHGENHVLRVGQLNTQLRLRVSNRTHAERNDEHGAALHGTAVVLGHFLLQLDRIRPVVGRTSVLFLFRSDERAGLHTSNVLRVRAGKERVRALFLIQLDKSSLINQVLGKAVPLFFRAISKDNLVWLGQFCDLSNPAQQFGVLGRGLALETRNRRCGHQFS